MLVNLTQHELKIHVADGGVVVIPPSGEIARVETAPTPVGTIDGVPVSFMEMGEISGLPTPSEGVHYIVSLIVAKAAMRLDVLSPGALVRDESGRPTGCLGLASHVPPTSTQS